MNGRIKRGEPSPRLGFPKIGSIKCGMKVKRGAKEFPTSVDYFIPAGKYAKYFTDVYGEKPQTLQVVFLHDNTNLVCDERLELRDKAGKLVAYGDGMEFMVYDPGSDKYKKYALEEYPDMIERLTAKHGGGWKTTLTLRFLLPKISGIIGYWELTTRAEASSIPEIVGVFDNVMEQKGFVKGILFDLNVQLHISNKPGSSSRYPVITLVPNHSEENRRLISEHFKIENETKHRGIEANIPGEDG